MKKDQKYHKLFKVKNIILTIEYKVEQLSEARRLLGKQSNNGI